MGLPYEPWGASRVGVLDIPFREGTFGSMHSIEDDPDCTKSNHAQYYCSCDFILTRKRCATKSPKARKMPITAPQKKPMTEFFK